MSDPNSEIDEALAKSKSTDVKLLIRAKEMAKMRVKEDPSATNLRALDYATRQLEELLKKQTIEVSIKDKEQSEESNIIKNVKGLLAYIETQGRKVSRATVYRAINSFAIKKRKDGSFLKSDADAYIATLPYLEIPEDLVESAAERQKKKEEEDIRRLKETADKLALENAITRGEYIRKEKVFQELASRVVVLSTGLKNAFEAHSQDIIEKAEGNPKKAPDLVAFLHELLEKALDEYANDAEFEVDFIENEV